ncbi:MAG: hypothetical protein ABJN34_12270 [Litoreibacter sp.]|uniref:RSP_7527 family protein n=1 Tax=Litoreibacter sp. TaxID=1969459 RepID=UPI0032977FAB
MNIDNQNTVDLDAIERQARQLRAEYTVGLFAAARVWIVSKFTTPALNASKAA